MLEGPELKLNEMGLFGLEPKVVASYVLRVIVMETWFLGLVRVGC